MLKDIELIADFIKRLSANIYGKEIFFYDKEIDMWYSIIDCAYIKTTEVIDWLERELY